MTAQERIVIQSLRLQGYAVTILTPEEVGVEDAAHLEDEMAKAAKAQDGS